VRIMPLLGDICVIALPERRPYVQGVLDKLGAPNAYYMDPVMAQATSSGALSPGDVACVKSHRKCVSWYLQHGTAPHVLVFEDDIEVTVPNVTQRLASAVRHLPPTWDALYVGRCWDRCWLDKPVAPGLVQAYDPSCTHAIAYSRSGASAVERQLRVISEPVDNALNAMIHRGTLDAYALKPGLFRQDNWRFGTTSGTSRPHYTEAAHITPWALWH
jgi:GR25 family glycosyltransferase involved in LPS biosynthesis